MKLKTVELNGTTYAEVRDGKPLFMHDDGKEIAFDAPGTTATISRLNGEAMRFREGKEDLEKRFRAFEGIEDAEAAKKALETVKNLKEGDLYKAGQVEEIKAAAKRSAEETVAANAKASTEKQRKLEQERDSLRAGWDAEKIGNAFARSKFITDKVAIPPDMMQAQFGRSFKVEDGKILAMDAAGKTIFSNARAGEVADFDEAIETLVHTYPYRDQILKGSGSSGSGARQSHGGGGNKTVTRADYEKMNPMQQRTVAMDRSYSIVD